MRNLNHILFISVTLSIIFLTSNLNAQKFDLSVQSSYVKFDIDYSSKVNFRIKQYPNKGFEAGPVICFRPKFAMFAFHTGLLYNELYYGGYSLKYLNIPLGLDIEIGKKVGVFLGFGVKFRNLLKVPKGFLEYHSEDQMSRFLLSQTARVGLFFKTGNLTFKLFPQVEITKKPLYDISLKTYPREWYLNTASLNLIVSFWNFR